LAPLIGFYCKYVGKSAPVENAKIIISLEAITRMEMGLWLS
jgi:hypothetical protein